MRETRLRKNMGFYTTGRDIDARGMEAEVVLKM